ncbi:MAG: hypothetical protein Q9P44_16455 [Anaerolineae bacterium]|nr:hypothetical protein [Anaerolineae bacterium]
MPIIRILIFRGTGGVYNPDHPHHGEPALVRAGHVGISGVIDDKIIGFHPTTEAAEALGGEKMILEALMQKKPQPGRLQDDDAHFKRASELVEATNGRTTVYMYEAEISEETFQSIRSWYTEQKEALYNFPNDDGQFQEGECNCAIFWQRFSIPLPVPTGLIRDIADRMQADDYDIWSKDS